jgi:hypothetical protein
LSTRAILCSPFLNRQQAQRVRWAS